MENQKATSKSIILNYGLYLGIISVLLSLIVYAMGDAHTPHWSISLIGFALLVVLIVLGIKKYKESNDGFISWGQAVKVGVGIALISAVISIAYQQVFVNFIEPDFMNVAMELQNQRMIDQGLTSEQIDAANEMGKNFSGPVISSAIGLIVSAFLGFVISAIAGAIMKQSKEEQY
ncbi:hypothetical protein GCM10011416_21140 [Polaribacter pacificus]|uniref:DUF4199 domain-containing protein n=1 Tax=Polaribacter pacificus TaxID=1775173 RepID=A0A917MGY0_9FLAO|nr:DUF4199 domain-containing protein [Polaribacter pacificus]GGH02129.1 hypothetical protein GCM10011416_21140 [Polaribacter pacificus]